MNHQKGKANSTKSEQDKLIARKKDAERKRLERKLRPPKRRSDMSAEELTVARNLDRVRKQKDRTKKKEILGDIKIETMEEKKYRKQLENNRKFKQKQRKSLTLAEKEMVRVQSVIGMRKFRLLESEQSKSIARYKAKVGMRVCRKEGPMREYTERNRKHIWAVKWRKFLSNNPKIRALDDEKKNRKK